MITIYARKDLGYRRGKMAAQSAHALMKLMLESFEKQGEQLFCSTEVHRLLQVLATQPDLVKIEWVDSAERIHELEELHGPHASSIIDNGKTESNGIPTLTCLAVDNSKTFKRVREIEFEESRYNCKQVLVMRSDMKLSKEQQMATATQVSCKVLSDTLTALPGAGYVIDLGNESNELLSSWLSGAFAKIGVKGKGQETMESILELAAAKGLTTTQIACEGEILALGVGPATAEMHQGVTSELKLY
ncbi:peptidyl-tRNA hydrolase [Vibrio harveyi]|uniref:peptidyl-tRNA hydrolase n=1 Tax=Vibrio harveyi TaxID=669 RepID=UPI003CF960E7